MRKTTFLIVIIFLILGCSLSFARKHQQKTLFLMDTVISVKIDGSKDDLKEIEDIIVKYDKMFNAYDETGEISKINDGKSVLTDDMKDIISRSLELSHKTNGSFDITLKTLTDLWGISNGNKTVPSEEQIKNALLKTGYKKITLNEEINLGETKLDLGGVAKGYVTEKIIDKIKERNIKKAIVDLGGNIYVYDSKKSVNVGIQKPFSERGEALLSLELNDKSIITSGTYERYFESGGKIYHHILNPKTGYPAQNGINSVTIIGEPFKGDAYSTAILVMGIDEAIKLYNSEKDFEFIVVKDKTVYYTKGLDGKINLKDKEYKMEMV